MLEVLTCIAVSHHPAYIAAAVAICTLVSAATFLLAHRASVKVGRARLVWISVAAIAAGYGIWATHFIAMQGYKHTLPDGYDISLTIVSGLIAISCCFLALDVATTRWLPRWRLWVG